MRETLKPWIDRVPTGDEFDRFAGDVHALLPGKPDYEVVKESLWLLAGQQITNENLDNTCWRLAGNLNRLRRKITVLPWTRQEVCEWVPVQVFSTIVKRNKYDKLGVNIRLRILAGSPCPMLMTVFWSRPFCRFLSNMFGFAKFAPSETSERLPRNIYTDPCELVTLRFQVLIDPKKCTALEPGFERIRCPSALLQYNKRQLKFRDRLDPGFECRFGQPQSLPCRKCNHGFVSCPGGCHKLDYIIGNCIGCGRDNVWFDPEQSTLLCVDCIYREATTKV